MPTHSLASSRSGLCTPIASGLEPLALSRAARRGRPRAAQGRERDAKQTTTSTCIAPRARILTIDGDAKRHPHYTGHRLQHLRRSIPSPSPQLQRGALDEKGPEGRGGPEGKGGELDAKRLPNRVHVTCVFSQSHPSASKLTGSMGTLVPSTRRMGLTPAPQTCSIRLSQPRQAIRARVIQRQPLAGQ